MLNDRHFNLKYFSLLSAPENWGKLHSKIWDLCEHGKQQSPIEIDPKLLLFDPNLTNLNINTASVSIVMYNLNFRNTCDIW